MYFRGVLVWLNFARLGLMHCLSGSTAFSAVYCKTSILGMIYALPLRVLNLIFLQVVVTLSLSVSTFHYPAAGVYLQDETSYRIEFLALE